MAVSREKVIGEAILRSSVRFLELTGWEREEEGSGGDGIQPGPSDQFRK